MDKIYKVFFDFVKLAVMNSKSHEELSRLVTEKTIEVTEIIEERQQPTSKDLCKICGLPENLHTPEGHYFLSARDK